MHVAQRHLFTVDQYLRMAQAGILREDQRVELIEGAILDIGPKGPRHAAVVSCLLDRLGRLLGSDVHVRSSGAVRLDDLSLPEADVLVVRGRPHDHLDAYPAAADVLLVVEIADASRAFDRGEKAFLYARHGVPEYWVVDLAMDEIVFHTDPGTAGYRSVRCDGRGAEWVSAVVPEIRIRGTDIL